MGQGVWKNRRPWSLDELSDDTDSILSDVSAREVPDAYLHQILLNQYALLEIARGEVPPDA